MDRTLRVVVALALVAATNAWPRGAVKHPTSPDHAITAAAGHAELIGLVESRRPDTSLQAPPDRRPAFSVVGVAAPPERAVCAARPTPRRPPPYRRRCPQRRSRSAESDVPS